MRALLLIISQRANKSYKGKYMAKGKKKTGSTKPKASGKIKSFEKIKKMLPGNLMPSHMNKEEVKRFLHNVYTKSASALSIGAKKVGETSGKLAKSTKLYYDYNQLKVKLHLVHTKLGELVETSAAQDQMQAAFNDANVKKLLGDLENIRSEQSKIKEKLAKVTL